MAVPNNPTSNPGVHQAKPPFPQSQGLSKGRNPSKATANGTKPKRPHLPFGLDISKIVNGLVLPAPRRSATKPPEPYF